MFKLKVLYVLFYFAFGCSVSYFSQFFNFLGIDGKTTGAIFSLGSLVAMVCQPLLGILADKSKRSDLLIIGLLIMMIIGTLGLYFFPTLILAYLGYIFYNIAVFGIMPLLDGIVLGAHFPFGKVRLFGSVGYAIGSLVAGKVNELYGINSFLTLSALLALFSIGSVLKLDKTEGIAHEKTKLSDVKELFTNKKFISFLIFSILILGTNSAYSSFLSLYFTNIGGTLSFLGAIVMLMTLVEVPFMHYSDLFIKKIGTKKLLAISGFMYSLRWLSYYFFTDPSFMGKSFIIQGLTAGIFFATASFYIKEIVSKKVISTAVTIFMAAGTLGGTIIQIISGIIIDSYGVVTMQLFLGIVALIGTIIFIKPTKNVL